jgi:hypothetical protein
MAIEAGRSKIRSRLKRWLWWMMMMMMMMMMMVMNHGWEVYLVNSPRAHDRSMTSHRHILNCIGELIRRKTIQTPN